MKATPGKAVNAKFAEKQETKGISGKAANAKFAGKQETKATLGKAANVRCAARQEMRATYMLKHTRFGRSGHMTAREDPCLNQ